jgi:hypothetical protein
MRNSEFRFEHFNVQHLFRNPDINIFPDFHLASQPDIGSDFLTRKIGSFSGQQRSAAAGDSDLAMAARTLAATGGRDKDFVSVKSGQQGLAAHYFQRFLTGVNIEFAYAIIYQEAFGND